MQNLINFGEARLVDEILFCYSGGYWTSEKVYFWYLFSSDVKLKKLEIEKN
jgi:hypothetical protein